MSRKTLPPNLVDSSGAKLSLKPKPLAQGGEGRIYEVTGAPDIVAKVYTGPEKSGRSDKLRTMAGCVTPEILKIAAWPTKTLHQRPGGPVLGFTMPRIVACREIHHLYSIAQRRKDYPHADFRFLAHAARNCAIAFETIHAHGHVIGDVNQKNVMVSDQALIRFVDCDSFQVRSRNGRAYRCTVGVPEFTPPELHGKSFATIDRDEEHDRFGLAVLIFHILMMGRHPFAGRFLGAGDMPLERAISEGRYAYSASAASFKMQPPPNTPPTAAVGPHLSNLFERAFALPARNAHARRPSATEWKDALAAFGSTLTRCKYSKSHYYTGSLAICPWCKIQADCGVIIFPGPPPPVAPLPDVLSLLAQFRSLTPPSFNYARPTLVGFQPVARPIPANLQRPKPAPTLTLPPTPPLLLINLPPKPPLPPPEPIPPYSPPSEDPFLPSIALVATLASLFFLLFSRILGVLFLLGFGGWFFSIQVARSMSAAAARWRYDQEVLCIRSRNQSREKQHRQAYEELIRPLKEQHRSMRIEQAKAHKRAVKEAEDRYQAAEQRWRQGAAPWLAEYESRKRTRTTARQHLLKAEKEWGRRSKWHEDRYQTTQESLSKQAAQLQELDKKYKEALSSLAEKAKEAQKQDFLDKHLIRDARLKAMTSDRISSLASFGIETAADVERLNRVKVPGIGPVLTKRLRDWSRSIEKRFRFDKSKGIPPAERRPVDAKFAPSIQFLAEALSEGMRKLESIEMNYHRERSARLASIDRLLRAKTQADADVKIME